MHTTVEEVTERIRQRSQASRQGYLAHIDRQAQAGPSRASLSCSNLAHGMAACQQNDKQRLTDELVPNLAIVTAYNDMLSAHQPYQHYPDIIKSAAADAGAVAQVAGGVPAMCDGVTQGQPGMELSLFSRDLIALATSVSLSHNMFDAAMFLGICDKIVPGLTIGALAFGHLPAIFVPAGPMRSGLPNKEKAKVRESYAAGEATRNELIAAESASYHSAGTCTFYGTANSNQMLMEIMGLQLPGSSFINPDDPLRDIFTREAVHQVLSLEYAKTYTPIGRIVDERALVNAVVGLLATGGSTNHTMHLVAIAAAAGIQLDWSDMAELSRVVPLLAQVYPNGTADVNQFQAAGGLAVVIAELLGAGLLHEEVQTVMGPGLSRYARSPRVAADALDAESSKGGRVIDYSSEAPTSADLTVVRPAAEPFQAEGGIQLLQGNLGRAVVKVSAVDPAHRNITAEARVFRSQDEFVRRFEAGELKSDMVAVVTGQGPRANGMPELHQLSPYLGTLQNQGFRVALLTDGRMSGASGKVLAAIQVTPETAQGGAIGKVADGDMITIDAESGLLEVDAELDDRSATDAGAGNAPDPTLGMGRELFALFRQQVGSAEAGASIFSGSFLGKSQMPESTTQAAAVERA